MSRWSQEFLQHPFQQSWEQIQSELKATEVDDQTVVTSVQELARLKRVITYLNVILGKIDPELTPKSVWNNFQSQTEACLQNIRTFIADKNITGIVRANENADNLLTYIRPYEIFPQATVEAINAAAQSHLNEIEEYIKSFSNKSTKLIETIEAEKNTAEELRKSAQQEEEKISAYTVNLFKGTEDTPSLKSKIDKIFETADSNATSINQFYAQLLIGAPESPSTKEKITVLEKNIVEIESDITELLGNVQTEVDDLNSFHEKIFGKKDDSGKPSGGLALELNTRTLQLENFEKDQKEKCKALVEQIETLLPGATSAGLGTAYSTLKSSFNNPIVIYTRLFYGSLGLLVLGAFIMAIDSLSIYPITHFEFIKITEWDTILKALLYKSPFVAPVVWLALFSSKRRSQYERLQQEYAHKEAIARSYESYRKQLQQLKTDTEELQKELLAKAIEAIAYNASITLDGKHDEKLPVQQVLEKFSPEEWRKFIQIFKP
jgi:hypothetical protein